jgi:hypothetical protein
LRSLKPDFETIADFRRDSRAAFRSVFRQFVLVCRRLDLFGRELLAVHKTRIKDRNFTRNSLQSFLDSRRNSRPWPTSRRRTRRSLTTLRERILNTFDVALIDGPVLS